MENKTHYTIRVYSQAHPHVYSHTLKWDNMPLKLLVKWRWYFEYRAALEKIKNPRYTIEKSWGSYQSRNQDLIKSQTLKRSISARKSHLSKWRNAAQRMKEEYNEIFPIEENHIFIHIQEKILINKTKLNELQKAS